MLYGIHETALNNYCETLAVLIKTIKRDYERMINRDLSQQKWQGLLERNVVLCAKRVYEEGLKDALLRLPKDYPLSMRMSMMDITNEKVVELFIFAVQKNRTSCAISNFLEEANLTNKYLDDIVVQLDVLKSQYITHLN